MCQGESLLVEEQIDFQQDLIAACAVQRLVAA